MGERRLDLQGLKCPLPAIRTRKALRALTAGDILVVTATDPLAAIDIPNVVRETGDTLDDMEAAGGVSTFRIRRGGDRPAAIRAPRPRS